MELQLIISLAFSAVASVLLTLSSLKVLQILQLSSYKPKGIFSWLKRTKLDYIKRYLFLAFFSFITAYLFVMSFPYNSSEYDWIRFFGFAFFIALSIFFIILQSKQKQKTKLVYTNRILRMIAVLPVVYFLISFILIFFLFDTSLGYSLLAITPLFIPFAAILAYFIMLPVELLIGKFHFNKAKRKLYEAKDLIKIGISGSYGKTTAKNILAKLLSEKYRVLSSPKSFNTPMGLSRIINDNDLNDFDVFIAEMGAKRVGEIEELCEFIKPRFGIVTKTGPQHLETFLTLDNAVDTEFSLAKNVEEFVVLNYRDELVMERTEGLENIFTYGGVDADYSDVEIGENGTEFALRIYTEDIKIQTRLLGRHIPEVFTAAALLAYKIGISLEDIGRLAKEIEPVKHRLELIKTPNGAVLDDAYNSNPDGARNALEVLSYFEGTKVVITPGFIELGVIEDGENYKLGQEIAGVANYLMAVKNEHIAKGAREAGMEEERIIKVNSLDKAIEELKKLALEKQAVLFLNDLPDNY